MFVYCCCRIPPTVGNHPLLPQPNSNSLLMITRPFDASGDVLHSTAARPYNFSNGLQKMPEIRSCDAIGKMQKTPEVRPHNAGEGVPHVPEIRDMSVDHNITCCSDEHLAASKQSTKASSLGHPIRHTASLFSSCDNRSSSFSVCV